MQTFLAFTLIALSMIYAAWRIYRLLQTRGNPCAGCQGCALKDAKRNNGENMYCTEKKSAKNLAK